MTDDAREVAGKTKDDCLTAAGGIAAAALAAAVLVAVEAAAPAVGICWLNYTL